MGLAVSNTVRDIRKGRVPARIETKSVFDVHTSRLGIGIFSRPLLDVECRKFRRAWEMEPLPGFEEFELDRERISFVAPAENVPVAWKSIDRMLALATEEAKKAS
jgi:hypothetical protein